MLRISQLQILKSKEQLRNIPDKKVLINTINAHSYNVAQKDDLFAEALTKGDFLIPDGASIVIFSRLLGKAEAPKERVAGWDLFVYEMERLNEKGGKCFFMGSSERFSLSFKKKHQTTIPILTLSPIHHHLNPSSLMLIIKLS